MDILRNIIDGMGKTVSFIADELTEFFSAGYDVDLFYTPAARWVFIFLAAFILLKAIDFLMLMDGSQQRVKLQLQKQLEHMMYGSL